MWLLEGKCPKNKLFTFKFSDERMFKLFNDICKLNSILITLVTESRLSINLT